MKKIILHIVLIFSCVWSFAQEFTLKPCEFNSDADEYAAVLLDSGIVFVSNRKESVIKALLDQEGKPTSSLYQYHNGIVQPFSKQINNNFNQGSACFSADGKTMYYTANINPKLNNRGQAGPSKLGIFSVKWDGRKWTDPQAFPWNETNCNTAHPCLDPSGARLYYSSDREGGQGGSDIYFSELIDNNWSKPIPLGQTVNTPGSELYPFVHKSGFLYFSSDGHEGEGGLDVFVIAIQEGQLKGQVFAPKGINSAANDFAITLLAGGKKGYVSSDRDRSQSDVFEIKLKYPQFNGCKEALEPSFCYLIQETKLKECDTLPLVYEWNFGDGTSARGLSVEHCFPDFGDYDVKLNVFDSISGHQFAAVSELFVSIKRPDYPIFEVPDTVKINESIRLELNKTFVDFMEVKECFWFDQKDVVGEGESFEWSSSVAGEHWLKVGLLSELTAAGYEQTCAYRKVVVVEDSPEFEKIAARRMEPELTAMQPRSSPVFFNDLGQRKPIVYFVELKSSLKQIPLSDPYFENVNYPITERYEFADSSFHYSVGEVSEITQLYRIYKQMIDAGYNQSLVMDRTTDEFDRSFVKRGMYFPEEVKSEMNTQMNKLSDIQFDTDSHIITKESYKNLQKVVEVMMLEPEIQLLVKAHTDDRGTATHNQTLSEKRAQAVKEFLIAKGISKNRIECLGYGNTQPIDDNKSEEGRARNRRVEFEILFEIMEKEKSTLPTGNQSER